jgi:hypothetical protein
MPDRLIILPMRILPALCTLATCFAIVGCASQNRRIASLSDGANGSVGTCGVPGADGRAGSINADALYALYPLCNVASIIVSANDVKKLEEYLAAGCDVTKGNLFGSKSSLWDLAVAHQRIDLLKVILTDPKAAKAIDLYRTVDPDALSKVGATVPLNAFEVAIYAEILPKMGSGDSALQNLYVGGQGIAMLNLLLAASSDKAKLIDATQNALQNLNNLAKRAPCSEAAADAINKRIKELSRTSSAAVLQNGDERNPEVAPAQ